MNIFTFNDDFGGHRSLFCESADVVGEDGEQFVRLEDHLASHAFDEEKERERFKEWAEPEGYDISLKGGKTFDSPETSEVWMSWKACAKSRANQ